MTNEVQALAVAQGSPLILSLFPGIGLLDRAFEEEGFVIVRGPDLLWGGNVDNFHPPAGVFAGIIGGPPCQCFVRYAALNRSIGNRVAPDKTGEFARCVLEAQPEWWLMENSPNVPDLYVSGYRVHRQTINNRWVGGVQHRERAFQFGSRTGARLHVEFAALEAIDHAPVCLASEGRAGRITKRTRNGEQSSQYNPRRPWAEFCTAQGLPADFLNDAPFTQGEKYRVVGNGVPLPMGRAVARAVRAAMANKEVSQ